MRDTQANGMQPIMWSYRLYGLVSPVREEPEQR